MPAVKKQNIWSVHRREIIAALVVIILFTIFTTRRQADGVEFDFGQIQMIIYGPKGASAPVTVDYTSIRSISLRSDLDLGVCENGVDSSTFQFGTWRNGEFDQYTLCAYTKLLEYIVLDTAKGIVVFNYQDPDATAHLYEAFVELLESKGMEVKAGVG